MLCCRDSQQMVRVASPHIHGEERLEGSACISGLIAHIPYIIGPIRTAHELRNRTDAIDHLYKFVSKIPQIQTCDAVGVGQGLRSSKDIV